MFLTVSLDSVPLLLTSDVKTALNLSLLCWLSCYREQYDKMKDDVMVQDEERIMTLEKEKDNVRRFH